MCLWSSFLSSDVGIVLEVSQKILEGKRVPWSHDIAKQWHNSSYSEQFWLTLNCTDNHMLDKLVRMYMGVRFEVHTSVTGMWIIWQVDTYQKIGLPGCCVVNGFPYFGGVLCLHLLGHVVMEALLGCLTLMVEALTAHLWNISTYLLTIDMV
jgi:hypothetical protein